MVYLKDHVLNEAQKYLGVGGLPAGIRILLSISRVVIKGLSSLRTAVDK